MYLYSIILVDDEDSTHELLKNYIENIIGGFKVVGCFKNGSEAIDFLEENSVNIVITDIKMPKVSGLELAKYIYENMPSVKVNVINKMNAEDVKWLQKDIKIIARSISDGIKTSFVLRPC